MPRSRMPPGVALCPITNRITIPFSSSNLICSEPAYKWKTLFWNQTNTNVTFTATHAFIYIYIQPLGTHVCRRDSRLFLLLNAVFVPMTAKAFCGGEALLDPKESLVMRERAFAISISNVDTDLSSDLRHNKSTHTHALPCLIWTIWNWSSLIINLLYNFVRICYFGNYAPWIILAQFLNVYTRQIPGMKIFKYSKYRKNNIGIQVNDIKYFRLGLTWQSDDTTDWRSLLNGL